MVRTRAVAIIFLVVLGGGMAFLPVVLGYTFLAGDTATAQVTECRSGSDLSCYGRWQDEHGRSGSGHISGVGRDDVGRTVEVRIGPLGAYAGGFGRSWPLFLTGLPLLIAPPFGLIMFKWIMGPARAMARRILTDPPGDATLLLITSTAATGLDGQERMTVQPIAAPPGFGAPELPGRVPRQTPRSAFNAAAGVLSDVDEFAVVRDATGQPAFVVERRGSAHLEPEAWLLDPGWGPQAVIRRVAYHPPRYDLLRVDGSRLGVIAPPPNVRAGAFLVWDAQGRQIAVVAVSKRRWLLRLEPVDPLLRDVVLAFVFTLPYIQR